MTFAEWYDSTIVPQLNETLKNVPVQAREPLRTASRQTMAACWNAALDAAKEHSYPMAQLIASRAVAVDELDDMKVVGA